MTFIVVIFNVNFKKTIYQINLLEANHKNKVWDLFILIEKYNFVRRMKLKIKKAV